MPGEKLPAVRSCFSVKARKIEPLKALAATFFIRPRFLLDADGKRLSHPKSFGVRFQTKLRKKDGK
jgi:hypothetical protein